MQVVLGRRKQTKGWSSGMLSNKWLESVVTVQTTSNRIVSLKFLTPGKTYNIISVYATNRIVTQKRRISFGIS